MTQPNPPLQFQSPAEPPARPPLLWLNLSVFSITGAIALIGVPWYGLAAGFTWSPWLAALVLYCFAGLSVTAGYHRLWAHKAYQAHPLLKVLFALGGALAIQNSALHWAADHRRHHRFVDDTQRDPYCAKRGLWFSHIGWMLREHAPDATGDYTNVRDLQNDRVVQWQHRHYLLLVLVLNFGLPIGFGLLVGELWQAVLVTGFLRVVVTHHTTFFINSLAHFWGRQTYTDSNTARDNGWLALVTFGEGYHNFHHIFASDYRNGVRWWQFDPTKWLIGACSWVGLTKKLRRTPQERIEMARYRMQLQLAQRKLAGKLQTAELLSRIEQEYDVLRERLQAVAESRRAWLEARHQNLLSRYEQLDLKRQYHELTLLWKSQKRYWQGMVAMA